MMQSEADPTRNDSQQAAPRVVCLCSLTRMGSSVTAYAAAHAVGATVLDEPLGPWDRTGPPYHYPAVQNDVRSAFNRSKGTLNAEVSGLLRTLAAEVGTRVVVKLPHLQVGPAELTEHLPDWPVVYLLRNPLKRLNSLYTRRWNHFTRPRFDLETTREFLRRWLDTPPPRRALFEDLQRDPRRFFAGLFEGWGWPSDAATAARAASYRAKNYHESSAEKHPGRSPSGVLSDHRRHVPLEAVRTYLNDPLIRACCVRLGWSTDPACYSEENASDTSDVPADLAERIRREPVAEPGQPSP
ncbi:MAG: hypothetical protein AAF108_08225 [Planctomycetota bacterium]